MNNIEIFNFEGKKVRTFIIAGEVWAAAKDIAGIFGYSNTVDAIARHCKHACPAAKLLGEREARSLKLDPQTKLINEGDINRLIFSSKLPQAEAIRDWWFEEVLPAIRKTGSYSLQSQLTIEEALNAYNFFKTSLEITKLVHPNHNQTIVSANKATKQLTGVDVLELIGATHLIPKPINKDELLTVTELGKKLNLSARRTNSLLELAGFQSFYRDDKGRLHWTLTKVGRNYATYLDTGRKQTNSNSVRQIKWYGEVVNQLKMVW